eukprot:m.128734 g.128734  ORF g.128734 m.128734 type:complete len:544 (-) comp17442_c0_seq1:167-1798(-)
MCTTETSVDVDVLVWQSFVASDEECSGNLLECIAIAAEELHITNNDCTQAKNCRNTYWTQSTEADNGTVHKKESRLSTMRTSAQDAGRTSCCLETLARRILAFHCDRLHIDPALHGAEWWIRVHDLHSGTSTNCSGPVVPFHFDKDETLRETDGRYVHPLLSTVTYIAAGMMHSGPTVVLPHRAMENGEGRLISGSTHSSALVSFPEQGKHICFAGNLLHGVPKHFPGTDSTTQLGENRELCSAKKRRSDTGSGGLNKTDGKRITFMVNVWPIESRPHGISRLDPGFIHAITCKIGADIEAEICRRLRTQQIPAEMGSSIAGSVLMNWHEWNADSMCALGGDSVRQAGKIIPRISNVGMPKYEYPVRRGAVSVAVDDFFIGTSTSSTREQRKSDGYVWAAAVAEFLARQFSETPDGITMSTTRLGCRPTSVATAVREAVTSAMRQRVALKMTHCDSAAPATKSTSADQQIHPGPSQPAVAPVLGVQAVVVVVATLHAPPSTPTGKFSDESSTRLPNTFLVVGEHTTTIEIRVLVRCQEEPGTM